MQTVIKKVIRASAGTGKTYRLSLEYIALLLRYRELGLEYGEILVLTFTRKATAEIRDRIFKHLSMLAGEGGTEGLALLMENLEKLLDRPVEDADRAHLRACYHDMLMNKEKVAISTIDTFTNKVFKSMIAPFLGLTNYDIADADDPQHLEELFSHALREDHLPLIRELLERSKRRRLGDFEKLVASLLDHRWMFHFIDAFTEKRPIAQQGEVEAADLPGPLAALHWQQFQDHFGRVLQLFQMHLDRHQKKSTPEELFKKAIWELVFETKKPEGIRICAEFRTRLEDEAFILEHYKKIIKDWPFWKRNLCYNKTSDAVDREAIEGELEIARGHLNSFLFARLFLPEQECLRRAEAMLADKYDEITVRDKIFKHSDITYLVYRELYNPQLSLVAEDIVANAFYELLASRIRFLLIDEFQDTSLVQFRILRPIISEIVSGEGQKPYGGAIVVGDEKQAIYGWRGGERDLLAAVPMMLQGADESTLERCFRSSPNVLKFINDFFSNDELKKALTARGIDWLYEPILGEVKEPAGQVCVRFYEAEERQSEGEDGEEETGIEPSNKYVDFVRQEVVPLLKAGDIKASATAILAREKKTLDAVAAALAEEGYDAIQESSQSVLHHRAVRPMVHLLRYLAGWDVNDLLRFWRSDYVRMPGVEFKRVLLAHRRVCEQTGGRPLWALLRDELPDVEAVRRTARVIESCQSLEPLLQCRLILEQFSATQWFTLENDWKNVDHFLQKVAEFEQNPRDRICSAAGMLAYFDEMEEDENLKMVGLSQVDAIRLMTIHKSKGMEFDTVFFFWDPDAGRGGNEKKMEKFLRYSGDFQRLEEYALTFNHAGLIEDTELFKAHEIKADVEELNVLYVALTRAKYHLNLFVPYKPPPRKKSDDDGTARPIKKLLSELLRHYVENAVWLKREGQRWQAGHWQRMQESSETALPTSVDWRDWLDMDRSAYWVPRPRLPEERFLNYKTMYLKQRGQDRGNVVHYFLSMIKFDSNEARQLALRRTRAFYGTLLPAGEIERLARAAGGFLEAHSQLYSQQQWDRVFTEFTLYGREGQERRIDRLMVSEKRREVLIIDYKTGDVLEPQQLEEYVHLVESIEPIGRAGYRVRGEYCEINIEGEG